jgi:cytochrome c peroxidase
MLRKILITCLLPVAVIAQEVTYDNSVLAPGWTSLTFTPPTPSSYTLASFSPAKDGPVINQREEKINLHNIYEDKVTLLNFMYTTCTDINGCPLATAVFHKIQQKLSKDPEIGKQVSLVSLSFDPKNDTPEIMKLYGAGTDKHLVDWQFITTKNADVLDPILDGYQQRIIKEYDSEGNYVGSISHILRVFLIDKDKQIRNIYSVSFLHADLIINDIKTLLDPKTNNGTLIAAADTNSKLDAVKSTTSKLSKPGDNKDGYYDKDYESASKSLHRTGKPADLYTIAMTQQLGLPKLKLPEGTNLTPEKIELGRKLFFDRRLSHTDTISCAICHVPEMGFAQNELATAVGTEGRSVPRNAPTVVNAAFLSRFFHDARENSLEDQVWGPLLAHNEMANPSPGYILNKIRAIPDYQGLFENAYGSPVNMDSLSRALAAYQYSLLSGNSPFDKWYYGGESRAISKSAKRGFDVFKGKGNCMACHLVNDEYALFTDEKLHNTGIGFKSSMYVEPPRKKVVLAPGIEVDVDTSVYANDSRFKDEIKPNDLGLYLVTQDPNDRWKIRTPSLRNVELSSPYMHNGQLATLKEVVEFYNEGGVREVGRMKNETISPLMMPLNLSEKEVDDLVEFLKTLTGSNMDTLVMDAFAAPIGDVSLEDPNWFHDNKLKY